MKQFFLLILLISSSPIFSDEMRIETSSGKVLGYVENKVINWDDIPYAQKPVGNLRWKAPRKYNDESAVIQPKEGNFCVQRPSGLGGSEGDGYFSGSEDCLYLDIKAPKNNFKKELPVMFWIHGGGNTSGLKDIYDFSKMVNRHDVIVVTINYRLGPFGWFTHPSIQDLQDGFFSTLFMKNNFSTTYYSWGVWN